MAPTHTSFSMMCFIIFNLKIHYINPNLKIDGIIINYNVLIIIF
jgi:hypothetical protein